MSKYEVILADPPWSFDVWSKDTGNGRSAEAHYPTMSLEEICALPIGDLAADNCALFLWGVWPRIFDAEKVINAWGFEYKTLAFEWFKLTKGWHKTAWVFTKGNYRLVEKMFHFGMGYYFRANPEPCLLAIKGRAPVEVHNERNFIIAPIGRHSAKPQEQYQKIENVYPNTCKIELFARSRRAGWDVWGNEAPGGSDVSLEKDVVLSNKVVIPEYVQPPLI